MYIVCPHCSTSYAIDPADLGMAGRTVRCSRCKEVWVARPEDATELTALTPAMAGSESADLDVAAEWDALVREENSWGQETPHVDSPPIAGDGWADATRDGSWPSMARSELSRAAAGKGQSWFRRIIGPKSSRPQRRRSRSLSTSCAAMGALVLALLIWRVEMVRLLPQTAAFYKLVGLDVNLRGLRFKDVKISSETVEGKPVLVIEGIIKGEANRSVDLPRLRFSVRDAQGAELYAWNAVLEQTVLKAGETAVFKSRLASPPPEGRNIDVRFFNKRDLAGGHI
jgi:predicted Zn finger-like uncharacterized protein